MNRKIVKAFGRHLLLILLLLSVASSLRAAGKADWVKHENVKSLRGMDLPVMALRTKDCVFYAGLQYGPGKSDVLYMVFDCKERLSPHDVLYVYIPGHVKYGKAVRLKGRRRGDNYLFPSIGLASKFADVDATVDLAIRVRSLWDVSKIDADVEITCRLKDVKKARKATFVLKGESDGGQK